MSSETMVKFVAAKLVEKKGAGPQMYDARHSTIAFSSLIILSQRNDGQYYLIPGHCILTSLNCARLGGNRKSLIYATRAMPHGMYFSSRTSD